MKGRKDRTEIMDNWRKDRKKELKTEGKIEKNDENMNENR